MLYELVAQHAQTMLAEVRAADPEGGGLPRYVERELTAYLRRGVLAHGFARVRCTTCHDEIIVAFSCKRRGRCPSCTARRMAVATAAEAGGARSWRGGSGRSHRPAFGHNAA